MDLLQQIGAVVLLILGFGFVVFFHELGHFIAAKWTGIRVEQFAVGFGHAVLSWRKGLGVHFGNTQAEYERRIKEQPEAAASIGETEYRVNWIPLGGYVKMLGQDDMNPNARSDDPRSYNQKSIPARMLVVSAGVIMNIILAMVGFMILFLIGYRVPPPVVGSLVAGSPAQKAEIEVGDRILYLDDTYQHDFAKISLNVALLKADDPVSVVVQKPDGTQRKLTLTPQRRHGDTAGFLTLGIGKPLQLRVSSGNDRLIPRDAETPSLFPAETLALHPGEVITAINGQPAQLQEYYKLDRAIQRSGGRPVELTVRDEAGAIRTVQITPRLEAGFGAEPVNFAGMIPRPMVHSVSEDSPAYEKLLPDDVIVSITSGPDRKSNPTFDEFRQWVNKAGQEGRSVDIEVLRQGQMVTLKDVPANKRLPNGQYGFGIGMDWYDPTPVVAGTVLDSPAQSSGIPQGATITSIGGQPVQSWFQVRERLVNMPANQPFAVTADMGGQQRTYTLVLSRPQIAQMDQIRYGNPLLIADQVSILQDYIEPRKTDNPALAAWWGVTETRDFVLQFYLTIKRMFQGSVSYKNMMGPVGIVTAGAHFAIKGTDWLIWFLAMISANLAVVNFLPIPIVDGGLFAFLILEKLQGRPLSQRAQSIAQMVGLAVILSVFLLVTYQDILRLIR